MKIIDPEDDQDREAVIQMLERYPPPDAPECPDCGLPMCGAKTKNGPWCVRCDS